MKMNTAAYNAMVDVQAKLGNIEAVSEIVSHMADDGCTPDVITHSTNVSENIMNSYTEWQDRNGGSYELKLKDGFGNAKTDKASLSTGSTSASFVSYVYGGKIAEAVRVSTKPSPWIDAKTDICEDNLGMFLRRGYFPNADIDYVFTILPSRSEVPKRLLELSTTFNNVVVSGNRLSSTLNRSDLKPHL